MGIFFPRCCGVDSPPMSPSWLYLKPLRNSKTFLHVIYKSKKKTNLLCILNNVFQYSKIRTRKRNAKKSIKTEKKIGILPFLESGIQYSESEIYGVESRIQDCHGFPYMGRKEPRVIRFKILINFKMLFCLILWFPLSFFHSEFAGSIIDCCFEYLFITTLNLRLFLGNIFWEEEGQHF